MGRRLSRSIRWVLAGGEALWALACVSGTPRHEELGELVGELLFEEAPAGDAFVFIHPENQKPVRETAPAYVTAVSELRMARGDTHFVFARILPNPYRVWALLDANANFDTQIDVLGQAGLGDRMSGAVPVNVEPGARAKLDLNVAEVLAREPPAFRVTKPEGKEVIEIGDGLALTSISIASDPLGLFEPKGVSLAVSLADENGDGLPEDRDGDGLLDTYPQVLLRFEPKPGQNVPLGKDGQPADVILPLAFDPTPFFAELDGNPKQEVPALELTLYVVPRAVALSYEPGRGRVSRALAAIPVGEYRLWVVQKGGQYWAVPNGLGTGEKGDPVLSQATRFRVVHQEALDGGLGLPFP